MHSWRFRFQIERRTKVQSCLMMLWIRRQLTELGVLTARPAAFLIFAGYVICWFLFSRNTLDWAAVAMLATWAMTLVIQRAEHRDTQAIHAKLDELLRIHGEASNDLMRVDEEDAEEIEKERRHLRRVS
jgi:low affinity Fe/Cu permease